MFATIDVEKKFKVKFFRSKEFNKASDYAYSQSCLFPELEVYVLIYKSGFFQAPYKIVVDTQLVFSKKIVMYYLDGIPYQKDQQPKG